MWDYLPLIIIAALVVVALLWWVLSARPDDGEGKAQDGVAPPKAVPAPPVAAAPPPSAPSMMDAEPVSMKAVSKPKPSVKSSATKTAPVKTAKPTSSRPAATKNNGLKPSAPTTDVAKTVKSKREATAPKPAPTPKPKAAAKSVPKPLLPDNLLLLKGLGPKVNAMLKDMGITSFQQVANWTAADVAEIDSKLGSFSGRITKENWVDQAQLLAAGDIAGFEKKYGALGI